MNTKISSARAYFEELVAEADPAAVLRGYVDSSEPIFETEWRDFKGARGRNDAPIDAKEIQKIWSKALSAFANTEGGVLFWGLDCRDGKDRKVDTVRKEALVHDVDELQSKLRGLISTATNPPIHGIEMKSYPVEGKSGFVICLVPEAANKPVRADLAGRNYYIRAGESSIIPSPAVLRGLFYPSRSAQFTVEITGYHSSIDVKVINSGYWSAEGVVIQLNSEPKLAVWKSDKIWTTFSELHTTSGGTLLSPRKGEITMHPENAISGFGYKITDDNPKTVYQLEVKVFAKDLVPQTFSLHVTKEELGQDEVCEMLPEVS